VPALPEAWPDQPMRSMRPSSEAPMSRFVIGCRHQGCAYQQGTAGGSQVAWISHCPSITDPRQTIRRPVVTTRPTQSGLSPPTMKHNVPDVISLIAQPRGKTGSSLPLRRAGCFASIGPASRPDPASRLASVVPPECARAPKDRSGCGAGSTLGEAGISLTLEFALLLGPFDQTATQRHCVRRGAGGKHRVGRGLDALGQIIGL
jgi:hypothetical protein